MPIDLEKISNSKERIIDYLRINGPSLPIRIASYMKQQTLFISAFLSELNADKKIKISHMRVGSSPLYYVPGQEELLERFTNFLNNREREAFQFIKEKKFIEDDKLTPILRVAMKDIKDFAIPLKIKIGDQTSMFWKYHLVPDEEIRNFLILKENSNNLPKENPILNQKILEKTELEKSLSSEKTISPESEIQKDNSENQIAQMQKKNQDEKIISVNSSPIQSDKIDFADKIAEYLYSKDIEIVEKIIERKKEYQSKIRIDSLFGKQSFLLHAKDKKTLSEKDLETLHQKAQSERMPGIFICTGKPDKKAMDYLSKMQNLIKFEKISL